MNQGIKGSQIRNNRKSGSVIYIYREREELLLLNLEQIEIWWLVSSIN